MTEVEKSTILRAGPYSIGSDLWPGLSKLIEECGEAMQVAGKIIATGGEVEHWDGTNLEDRLIEELGDLMAAAEFVAERVGQEFVDAVIDRSAVKLRLFRTWQESQHG